MGDTQPPENPSVLIVGAGTAGLLLANILHWMDVPAVVIDRRRAVSSHPRAGWLDVRSMEILRKLDLEKVVRAHPHPASDSNGLLRAESLLGSQHSWIEDQEAALLRDAANELSPTTWGYCGQDVLEQLLEERLPAGTVHRSWTLTGLQGDAASRSSVLTGPDGTTLDVRPRFIVAADGLRSTVRKAMRIGLMGRGDLSTAPTIVFRADLSDALRGRAFDVCMIENKAARGVLVPGSEQGQWVFAPFIGSIATDEEAVQVVREAIGTPEIKVEVEARDEWTIATGAAAEYARENVFLLGDAAHPMAPAGGFGMNSAMGDSWNLGWKLKAVLDGSAPESLLDTYQAERRPVTTAIGAQAEARFRRNSGQKSTTELIDENSLVLGQVYGAATGSEQFRDAKECLPVPGVRVPHVTLGGSDGTTVSPVELAGPGWALLAGHGSKHAEHDGGISGVPVQLSHHRIGNDPETTRAWESVLGLRQDQSLLIRPDGILAGILGQEDPVGEAVNRVLTM